MPLEILVFADERDFECLRAIEDVEELRGDVRFTFSVYEGELDSSEVEKFLKERPSIGAVATFDAPHYWDFRSKCVEPLEGVQKILLRSSGYPRVNHNLYDYSVEIPCVGDEFSEYISDLLG